MSYSVPLDAAHWPHGDLLTVADGPTLERAKLEQQNQHAVAPRMPQTLPADCVANVALLWTNDGVWVC